MEGSQISRFELASFGTFFADASSIMVRLKPVFGTILRSVWILHVRRANPTLLLPYRLLNNLLHLIDFLNDRRQVLVAILCHQHIVLNSDTAHLPVLLEDFLVDEFGVFGVFQVRLNDEGAEVDLGFVRPAIRTGAVIYSQ